MISKELAKNVSSEILQSEYDSLRAKRRRAFNFRYGHVLDKKIIVEFGDNPELINKALRYSHSRWQVILMVFVWLGASASLVYLLGDINFVVVFFFILSGGLAVARLINHYINTYLFSININR